MRKFGYSVLYVLLLTITMVNPVLGVERDSNYYESEYQRIYKIMLSSHEEAQPLLENISVAAVNDREYFWAGRLFYLLGYSHYQQGQIVQSTSAYLQSRHNYQIVQDLKWVANAENFIGLSFYETGDYERARYYYELAISKEKYNNDSLSLAKTFLNLGIIAIEQMQYEEADKWFSRSRNYCEGISFPDYLSAINWLGINKSRQGKYEEAISIFEQIISITTSTDQVTEYYPFAFNNIGKAYFQLGQIDLAQEKLEKALELKKANNLSNRLTNTFEYLARISISNHDFSKAISYLELAADSYEPGVSTDLGDIYSLISGSTLKEYATEGQLAKVKDLHNEFLQQKLDDRDAIQQLELQLELREAEKEFLLASQDQWATPSNNSALTFILIIIGVFGIGGFSYHAYHNYLRKRELRQIKQAAASAYLDAYEFLYGKDSTQQP